MGPVTKAYIIGGNVPGLERQQAATVRLITATTGILTCYSVCGYTFNLLPTIQLMGHLFLMYLFEKAPVAPTCESKCWDTHPGCGLVVHKHDN